MGSTVGSVHSGLPPAVKMRQRLGRSMGAMAGAVQTPGGSSVTGDGAIRKISS